MIVHFHWYADHDDWRIYAGKEGTFNKDVYVVPHWIINALLLYAILIV